MTDAWLPDSRRWVFVSRMIWYSKRSLELFFVPMKLNSYFHWKKCVYSSLDNFKLVWTILFFSTYCFSTTGCIRYVTRKDNVNALKLTYQPLVDFLIHRIMTSWIHNKIAEAKEPSLDAASRSTRWVARQQRGTVGTVCVLEFITHNAGT